MSAVPMSQSVSQSLNSHGSGWEFPNWAAEWLVDLDVGGGVIPRSPLASQHLRTQPYSSLLPHDGDPTCLHYFTTTRGAGQGSTHAPGNWEGFMDITLSALDAEEGSNALVQSPDGSNTESPDTGFVDDLATCFSTNEGIQRKSDIVSAAALFFGLQLNVSKL